MRLGAGAMAGSCQQKALGRLGLLEEGGLTQRIVEVAPHGDFALGLRRLTALPPTKPRSTDEQCVCVCACGVCEGSAARPYSPHDNQSWPCRELCWREEVPMVMSAWAWQCGSRWSCRHGGQWGQGCVGFAAEAGAARKASNKPTPTHARVHVWHNRVMYALYRQGFGITRQCAHAAPMR